MQRTPSRRRSRGHGVDGRRGTTARRFEYSEAWRRPRRHEGPRRRALCFGACWPDCSPASASSPRNSGRGRGTTAATPPISRPSSRRSSPPSSPATRRRACRPRRRRPGSASSPPRRWRLWPWPRPCSAPMATSRRAARSCSCCLRAWVCWPPSCSPRSAKAAGSGRRSSSSSATWASPAPSCSTTRCCPVWRRPKRRTGCRRPGTRSATSAAACCSS